MVCKILSLTPLAILYLYMPTSEQHGSLWINVYALHFEKHGLMYAYIY